MTSHTPEPVLPKTVLYLDHTAKLSGGEISLLRLLKSIDRTLVTPVVLLAEDGPLVCALSSAGVEVHVLKLSEAVRGVKKDSLTPLATLRQVGGLCHFARYVLAVARWAVRRNVDLIHTNSLKSDIYGAIAGRIAGVPVVWHVRDRIDSAYLPAVAVGAFRRLAAILPTHVITNSQSTLETLVPGDNARSRRQEHRYTVVHNGLNDDELTGAGNRAHRATGASGESERPLRVGIVGRLARWKGQHVFIEAAGLLLREADIDRGTEFVIIGGPLFGEHDYEKELRRQAVDLGIAENITFLGFQKDVPRLLKDLDILVHASITPEPFGQVILEGMATGLPVVATDAGGIREILVHRQTGLLVPIDDAVALAKEIRGLLCDPERRRVIGSAGYVHVCKNFRSANTARAVEAVYQKLVPASVPGKLRDKPLKRVQSTHPSGWRLNTGRFLRYFLISLLLLNVSGFV